MLARFHFNAQLFGLNTCVTNKKATVADRDRRNAHPPTRPTPLLMLSACLQRMVLAAFRGSTNDLQSPALNLALSNHTSSLAL